MLTERAGARGRLLFVGRLLRRCLTRRHHCLLRGCHCYGIGGNARADVYTLAPLPCLSRVQRPTEEGEVSFEVLGLQQQGRDA
jgi:hypothetical protein